MKPTTLFLNQITKGKVNITGDIYAIAFVLSESSACFEKINTALITMQEEASFDRIHQK